jgi:SAM-dependent methyltransferase
MALRAVAARVDREAGPRERPERAAFSLVVPLYNEVVRFAEQADRFAEFILEWPAGSELIFVDDGSLDATTYRVETFLAAHPEVPGRLIRRPHLGKGAAVRAGLEAATAEYAGFCDVDLSTPLDQLEEIFFAARLSAVLAIGSRDVPSAQLVRPQSGLREFLGKTYNRFLQLTVTPGISDTQCGAKVAATRLWRRILPHCRETGYAWDVEAVAIAGRLRIPVREVAVQWSHDDRSRVRVATDGPAMVLAVPRILKRVRTIAPAPADSAASGVFDDVQAATLLDSDTRHWWFRSKAAIVSSMIRTHADARTDAGRLVDVGAGAGGVTAQLGWRPHRLIAIDGSTDLARHGRARHALLAAVGVGERLPLADGVAGVVTLLDVIEHLELPDRVLREARRVLAPGGRLVVTVPAHQWLWSGADELLGHTRRYTRPLLREQLAQAGFRTLRTTHVFSWLLVPVWLQRRLAPHGHRQLGLDRTSPLLDALAFLLTALERRLVRRISLPFGTSIVCVATPSSEGGQDRTADRTADRPANRSGRP